MFKSTSLPHHRPTGSRRRSARLQQRRVKRFAHGVYPQLGRKAGNFSFIGEVGMVSPAESVAAIALGRDHPVDLGDDLGGCPVHVGDRDVTTLVLSGGVVCTSEPVVANRPTIVRLLSTITSLVVCMDSDGRRSCSLPIRKWDNARVLM
jgi:hypothetical protein